ncbi:hypothetical protein [Streptomyces sp. ODS28]|uniref:hypothetical protein n=1 Tax=Streptomyces sp. ODS28 TaxID=3136688 RepID=UPI0031EFDA4A
MAARKPPTEEERRTALPLALDGIDTGPYVIHGHHIGHPVVGFDGDVALHLTTAEAELLHAQLCFVLGQEQPGCRPTPLGSKGLRWP